MKNPAWSALTIWIAAVCVSVCAQTASIPATVFRLGVFDGALNEFAPGAPHEPVTADADSANAAREWNAHQPATMMGAKQYPRHRAPFDFGFPEHRRRRTGCMSGF